MRANRILRAWAASIFLSVGPIAAYAAGNDVGNGGMAIVCSAEHDTRRVHWIELADLAEAVDIRGLTLESSGTPAELYRRAIDRLKSVRPELASAVTEIASSIRLKLLSPVTREPRFTLDAKIILPGDRLVDACPGRLSVQQVVEYLDGEGRDSDRLSVNIRLRRALQSSALDSTRGLGFEALVLHEAIYRAMRLEQGALRSSDQVRAYVGLLFSTLDVEQLREEFARVAPQVIK